MKSNAKLMIAMVATLGSAVAFAADTSATFDKMKAAVTPGEFVLTGSQVKNIYEGSDSKHYRVCVKIETDAAPMKVTHDGQVAVLRPGECDEVSGKKIDAAPERVLAGPAHIVVTFHVVDK